MSASAEFAYGQARMQARIGERPSESDWQALDGIQSTGQYLERARMTALRRHLANVDSGMDGHAIDRSLRDEARRSAREVAGWIPPRWRPAISSFAELPDLPTAGTQDGATAAALAWVARWRQAWPRDRFAAQLALFAKAAGIVWTDASRRDPSARPQRSREPLARFLSRRFRQDGGTPAAVFCYLGLMFIDLDRLRGGLVRRRLFASENAGGNP